MIYTKEDIKNGLKAFMVIILYICIVNIVANLVTNFFK